MEARSIIDEVEAWHCRLTLETPIVLGSMVITHRDFVLVRVRTADGLEGAAYSLSRGAPVDLVVTELLGPVLLGQDALDIPRRLEDMSRSVVALGPIGVVGRAMSLIDICLWDIKGKAADLPVWRLLGGYRSESDVMLVAPYALPDETDSAYVDRLIPWAERGYRALKLYPLADPVAMARRLATLREGLGEDIGLVVDMSWLWRSSAEAIDAVASWESFHLAWVEDPMLASDWRSIRALSDAVHTPIAAGDDVSVRGEMDALIEEGAVDIVRVDSTTIGGLSAFAAVRELASRAGLAISPHAYPEMHRHCVFAWPRVQPVEIFAPASPTWGASQFLAEEVDLPTGGTTISAPTEPGLGIPIDWDAVKSLSTRSTATAK